MTNSRALISVYDKTGIVEFAKGLESLGFELISTGGTFRELDSAGLKVARVAEVTEFPEILDGRVKTLHPSIHGGILADRRNSAHTAELEKHGISPIDLVVVNLYPFRETVADSSRSQADIIEMIDIGGPCMVRAAAKNHQSVLVVVDPIDYDRVFEVLEKTSGQVPESLRRSLAGKAFSYTQAYDEAVATWFATAFEDSESEPSTRLTLNLELEFNPRYGENPHQHAALYRDSCGPGVFGNFEQLQGKELSFNNLLDSDAARRVVALFESPAVAIVKHNNPCGVGQGERLSQAYLRALECDPISAFGSVVACTESVDSTTAKELAKLFVEVIIAPGFDDDALDTLSSKKNLRLLRCPVFKAAPDAFDLRSIEGGFLSQDVDSAPDKPEIWTCPTAREPNDRERAALSLAWKVVRQVKSNAIVIGNENQTTGIGAGQMSRVDSCRLAVEKAQIDLSGCVAASDAFFPFADGLEVLADAGITAVIQPGGSKNDRAVIEAANARNMAILLTGQRHFKH